jgi:hypothetical protein
MAMTLKEAVILKALNRGPGVTLKSIALANNIGASTLGKWLTKSRKSVTVNQVNNNSREMWLNHLINTNGMDDVSLGTYCRKHGIYSHQLTVVESQLGKGEILAQVLDMHDALEESDQGKSFRAFWDFLMSSQKQDTLSRCLEKILHDLVNKPYLKGMQYREYIARLKGFKADLLQRGRKVLASQNRLTREIRTLLVQNASQDARAIQTTITDIKAMCITDREYFARIASETLIEIEYKPQVNLPMERPLWSEPNSTTLDFGELLNHPDADLEDIQLNGRSAPAYWQLEDRVNSLLQTQTSFALPKLLDAFPPEFELEELTGYLAVGMKNKQHLINREKSVTLNAYLLPEVIFQKDGQTNNENCNV